MFFQNYLRLCNKHGISPSAAALEMGISKPTVTRWKKGGTPNDATLQRIADYFSVPVSSLTEEPTTLTKTVTGEKAPASVSESERPYVDLDTKMIWAPTPVSILAAQYDVPSPVLAEIVGCNADHASFMIFGTVNPTDEELLRIAAAFCVTPDSLRKGWVPLYANQYVADDIARRKSNRIPRREDSQS